MLVAQDLERKIREKQIPHENSTVDKFITISAGLATREGNMDGDAPALIGLADNLLYRAKQTGRGRVCGEILTASK
jgi:PleD family two-component response regulator